MFAALAEGEADGAAEEERHDDADDGDGHRRAADPTQLGEIHLHPDLHEEEEHADLGEGHDRLAVGGDPAEQGRPDQDADDDLADDGRNADPLAELGGELGGDQDHCQVEQHRPSVGSTSAVGPAPRGGDTERSRAGNTAETRRRRR